MPDSGLSVSIHKYGEVSRPGVGRKARRFSARFTGCSESEKDGTTLIPRHRQGRSPIHGSPRIPFAAPAVWLLADFLCEDQEFQRTPAPHSVPRRIGVESFLRKATTDSPTLIAPEGVRQVAEQKIPRPMDSLVRPERFNQRSVLTTERV